MCGLEYTLAHLPRIRFSYHLGNERSVAVPRTDGRTHTPLHARIYRLAHIHYLPDGDPLRDSRRQPTARVSGEEEEVYRGAAGAERRAGHGYTFLCSKTLHGIGYLFCVETMTKHHELQLMLVNTLRKVRN